MPPKKLTTQARRIAAAKAAATARGQSFGTRKDGKPKVYWKDDEKLALARELAMGVRSGEVRMDRLLAPLLKAQTVVLAPERHRVLHAVNKEAWLRPAIEQELKALDREAKRLAQAQVKEEEEFRRASELSPAPAAEAPQAPLVPAPLPEAPVQALKAATGLFGPGLRQLLVEELASIFTDAMRLALARGLEDVEGTPPPKPQAAETRPPEEFLRPFLRPRQTATPRPTVLVIGLRGAQMGLIEAEYGDEFDMRFHGSAESKDALKAKASSADIVVGVTDFMSHSIEDVARARATRYIRSGGGMTSLRSTLDNLRATAQAEKETA